MKVRLRTEKEREKEIRNATKRIVKGERHPENQCHYRLLKLTLRVSQAT